MSRGSLQVVLGAIGTVATAAGARGVLVGANEVVDAGVVSANVDSEYRFYASFYSVFGVLLLRAARAPESETVVIRAASAGFLVAACGRMLSIRRLGRPHPLQQALMLAEFVIPVVVVPWQARVRDTGD